MIIYSSTTKFFTSQVAEALLVLVYLKAMVTVWPTNWFKSAVELMKVQLLPAGHALRFNSVQVASVTSSL